MTTVSERIARFMAKNNIKQKELAARINITQASVSGFVTGKYNPSDRTITDICREYGVREEWLRNGKGQMMEQTSDSIVTELAKKYRLGKNATALLAAVANAFNGLGEKEAEQIMRRFNDALSAHLAAPEDAAVDTIIEIAKVKVPRFVYPSAAGAPLYAESECEEVEYPADAVPEGTSFAVGIMGRSMEPDFPDGCTVFVNKDARVEDGDIAVVWIDGEEGMVCKRVRLDGDTVSALESINPEFADITGPALDGMRIYGKVVGKIM